MNRFPKISILFSTVILFAGLFSTDAEARYEWSVSLWGGYFLPTGDWKQHRYAPNVDQFGGMPHFALDIEYRFDRYWSVAVYSQYNALSTADWEKYIEQQGEYIDAEAHMFNIGLVVRPHVAITSVNRTMIEFGLGLVSLSGRERYSGLTYDYDFLAKGGISLLGAVEQDWLFADRFALIARIGIIYAPEGINYADGESRRVVGFPFSIGIRYLM